ncbi:hypothetical protein HG530_013393 [Fusarium avenaceum]|nr:hypothetical protein HG530_013393 [Fusarium avenaceum]
MLFPVVHVNLGNTSDEELKLTLIKDVDKILRDELLETLLESLELLSDTLLNTPLDHEIDIFLLILVGNINVSAVRNEILGCHDAEPFIFGRESLLQNATRNIVIEHPLQ